MNGQLYIYMFFFFQQLYPINQIFFLVFGKSLFCIFPDCRSGDYYFKIFGFSQSFNHVSVFVISDFEKKTFLNELHKTQYERAYLTTLIDK